MAAQIRASQLSSPSWSHDTISLRSSSGSVERCFQELSAISVIPGTEAYQLASKIYNPAFDFENPAFITLPSTVEECQKCLAVANINKVPVAVRSGGHCFSGYSTIDSGGFVISLAKMRSIQWIDEASAVKVQAGASWNDVYKQMPDNKLVVGGCCPSVGIGGYVLGGGYGLLSRKFGLGSDNALSMTMVTTDGERVVTASPNGDNSDLFWAMCGGGGGNFGVLVDVTFKTHPAPPSGFTWISFAFHSQQESEMALKAIGKYVEQIPDGLNVDMLIHKLRSYNQLNVDCVFSDSELADFPLVKELRELAGSRLHKPSVYKYYRDLSTDYAQRHSYVHFEAKPVYMKGSFINDFPASLADQLINLQLPDDPMGIVEFVHVGGQIASKSPSFSAYPNRLAQYNCYTYGRFQNKSEWDTVFRFANHVNSLLISGGYAKGAYVNYMDRFLHDWTKNYYGGNYAKLCNIKSKWNPVNNGGSLHFLQEIGSAYNVPSNVEPDTPPAAVAMSADDIQT